MNQVEFLKNIVSGIVKEKSILRVYLEEETEEEMVLQLVVSKEDAGFVIGKNGQMISHIKALVDANQKINNTKKVRINIETI